MRGFFIPVNYYNEFDRKTAAWLRELIKEGHIPNGDVDERSITDVHPSDLAGYTQCHFFAGIGGWSYALKLAGWPTDRPVWTGSCPCQPFSTNGLQKGTNDTRHLWPVFFRLIKECGPSVIFGEQVKNAVAHGWLDEVGTDLEAEDYSFGAAVLPACSVSAPHQRDRAWFVASHNRSTRRTWGGKVAVQRQPAFSWSQDVRRVEDLRNRSDIPEPLLRSRINGISDVMGALHGFGNAIVPQVAAEFVLAAEEAIQDLKL